MPKNLRRRAVTREPTFEKVREGGPQGRLMARFVCDTCGAHVQTPLVHNNAGGLSGTATVQRAIQGTGWTVNGARVSCPRCVAATAARAKGDRPDPKPEPRPQPAEVIPMTETKPREASPQERIKIRSILDKHFDDGAGQWLDGYSDQRAGEEIGVPWALVTRIREAAYGPIRVDPEIGAIRAELIQIGRDLATMTERHAAAQKRLDALLAKRAA